MNILSPSAKKEDMFQFWFKILSQGEEAGPVSDPL
ncbi:hypothetical protein GFGA_1c0357 [Gluconobacter frateurii NBRC 103465]|nr:hypothetical protein GFGA_1c0357 [Gluconobacter frateurii NBRC 103465]